MGKIFCLIGKSSSGKDTLFKLLKEDCELNLKPIIPYTTRPKRNNETSGVEYFFIDKIMFKEFEKAGKIIEKREYNTVDGIWYYATIDDGQIDLFKNYYILITTLEAYKNIQEYFNPENVIPIYITVDDAKRLERALAREKLQQNPNYNELCRRFLADNDDFSSNRLSENKIENQYCNTKLVNCFEHIKNDIINIIQCDYTSR